MNFEEVYHRQGFLALWPSEVTFNLAEFVSEKDAFAFLAKTYDTLQNYANPSSRTSSRKRRSASVSAPTVSQNGKILRQIRKGSVGLQTLKICQIQIKIDELRINLIHRNINQQ
jgi:hypothetical protein